MIRLFNKNDADEVSQLIAVTLRTSNIKDYSSEYIENTIKEFSAQSIIDRSEWTHFYVCEIDGIIAGCGAIGPYWGKEDESSLFNIFVHPQYQSVGWGKAIVDALEKDDYFLRAKRIEVPASITALQFYIKMGYNYKNGVDVPDEQNIYRLEKIRQV